jgi:hypothetical protein
MEKSTIAVHLKKALRNYFDSILKEPLPEALADLARQLDASETSKRGEGARPRRRRRPGYGPRPGTG